MPSPIVRFTRLAVRHLQGRTIVAVRYMTADERQNLDWPDSALVLELDSGQLLWPSQDDEGNGAGALFTTIPGAETFPVLRR